MSGAPEMITPAELQKLFKILGMLGSAHQGERAAAALKAHEWVLAAGTSWAELILPPELPPAVVSVGVKDSQPAMNKAQAGSWMGNSPQGPGFRPAPPPPPPSPPPPPVAPSGRQVSWKAAAQAVLSHYPGVLRGQKETDFVQGLLQKGWPKLTDKQGDWLRDICDRAGVSW